MRGEMTRSRLRSPLGRALGLGSAKEGVDHWWAQRITAVALVPLVVWFVVVVIELMGSDRAALVDWLHHPVPAVLWVLLLIAAGYHGALGLQVVIEDYIENEALRLGVMIVMKLAATLLAALGVYAVLKLSFAA
jgi:succinate dehydrogenase / fumarate reductase membrane anchor subunit